MSRGCRTATLLQTLFKHAVSKPKSLPLPHAKPLLQVLSAGGEPRPHLAISVKTKTDLKAPSHLLKDRSLLNLFPLSKTAFYQTPPLQKAPLSNLLENISLSGATPSVLLCPVTSEELPSGRRVSIITQGKGPTGSKRGDSGSNDSGIGGASGGDEGDGDPPQTHDETILEEEGEEKETIEDTQQPVGDNSEHVLPANTTPEGIQETQETVNTNIIPPETSRPTNDDIIRPFQAYKDIDDNHQIEIESEFGSDDDESTTPIEETQQPLDGKSEPVFPSTPNATSSDGWWDDIDIDID